MAQLSRIGLTSSSVALDTLGPRDRVTVHARLKRKAKVLSNGCWSWTGARNAPSGLPYINVRGRAIPAYRVSWWLWHGIIPESACIVRKCLSRDCCNPAHLVALTKVQMMRFAVKRRAEVLRAKKGAERRSKLDYDDVRAIISRYSRGEYQKDLAAEYGVSKGTISEIINRRHWKAVDVAAPPLHGRKPYKLPFKLRSHLTAEDAKTIRELYAAGGTSHRKLAAQFGVSSPTITRILQGRGFPLVAA